MKVFLFAVILSSMGVQMLVSGQACGKVPSGSTIDDPTHCAKYYLCRDGVLMSMTCFAPYGYHSGSGRCEYISTCQNNGGTNPGPGTGPTLQNPCNGRLDGTYLPSPLSCNLFYACVGGMSILKNCPEGYAYDSLEAACEKRTEPCF